MSESLEAAAEVIEQKIYGEAGAPPEPSMEYTPPKDDDMASRISRAMGNEQEPPKPQPANAEPREVPQYQPTGAVTSTGIEIPPDLLPEVVALQNEYQAVDWERLKMMDPGRFAALKLDALEKATAIQQKLAQHAQHQRAARQQQEAMAYQQHEAQLAEANQRLLSLVPEWRDAKVREQETQELVQHLRNFGYTDAEISRTSDPRIIAVIRHLAKEARKPAPRARREDREDSAEREIRQRNLNPHSMEAGAIKIARLLNG